MDDDTSPRRSRLGATTLSAAALLVLSFGPATLALSPSAAPTSAAAPVRVVVSAPAAAAAQATTRSQHEEDVADGTAGADMDPDES